MNLSSSGKTHVGMKRTHNEDSLRIYRDENLFVVSDGMGGHASGEVASEMSAETIAAFFRATSLDEDITWPYKYNFSQTYHENRIRVGVQMSNQRIFQSSVYDMKLKGMGTTMVALSFYDDKCSIGHVGDSRVYRVRQTELVQLTEDHSLLNDYMKLRPGGMTPEEIENFPHKNVIVRALGMKDSVEVDVITEEVQEGDLLLLCSDGLSGMITDLEMSDIINRATRDAGDIFNVDLDQLCEQLIAAANQNGGTDNITVLLVRSEPEESEASANVHKKELEITSNHLNTANPFAPAWMNETQAEPEPEPEFQLKPKLESNTEQLETDKPFEVGGLDTIMDPIEEDYEGASLDITEEPVQATEEPVQATEEPVQATEEPVQATEEPVQATEEPVQATEEPVQATEEPVQATEEPVQATEEPVQASEMVNDLEQVANELEQASAGLEQALIDLDSPLEAPQEADLDDLGLKTLVAYPTMPIKLESEQESEDLNSNLSSSQSLDTVRILPPTQKEFETVTATQEAATTVTAVLPIKGAVTVKANSTELGLPVLSADLMDEPMQFDGLQTVRVLPNFITEDEETGESQASESQVDQESANLDFTQEQVQEIKETETQLSPVSAVEVKLEQSEDQVHTNSNYSEEESKPESEPDQDKVEDTDS